MALVILGPTNQVKYGQVVTVHRGFYEGMTGTIVDVYSEDRTGEAGFGVKLVGHHDATAVVSIRKQDLRKEEEIV